MLPPVERVINLTLNASQYAVCDIPWLLSQQNRKSYRQGLEIALETVEIFGLDPEVAGNVGVYRLPNTWATVNAWVKAFHTWKDQQDEALAAGNSEGTEARYRDFKLYYNKGHIDGEFAGTPMYQAQPNGFLSAATAQVIDPGADMEWEYSQFVIPNYQGSAGVTVEGDGYMLGPDSGADFGMIHNYAMSRARPHPRDPSHVEDADPTVADGGLFMQMQDVGENLTEVVDNVQLKNQAAPYLIGGTDSEEEFYPWGMNQPTTGSALLGVRQDKLLVRTGSTISTDQTGPFTCLMGTIILVNNTASTVEARIVVAPGPHKGIMARPMQDVN